MEKQKVLGVTEARFGLTILICGLVAIGYIVLLRLSPSNDASVEPRLETPRIASKPAPDEDQLTVLPLRPEPAPPSQPERSMLPAPVDGKTSSNVQRR
ncbi:MAG TPA: hypothetical protein VH107_06920 [Lacipirellulaceae bacterium]|nr:hypothetical protein [Lacipirellulaceae bacterium]